jgi:hypothetical protein
VVVETETSLISLYEIALPQIILRKPICEIKKKSSYKIFFSLNRVLMIHKYNTNQSIGFTITKKMPSTQFQNIGMVEGIQL